MEKFRAILKFLATLFLILMIWGAYTLISLVYKAHTNENLDYIPTDAKFVARVEGRKIIKSSISSVLLNEDEEIFKLVKESFTEEHDVEFEGIGVDFQSDLIIFHQSEEGHNLIGFLLNLSSPRIFKKNIDRFMNLDHVTSINGNVGLVLMETSNSDYFPITKLQEKADKILSKKSNFRIETIKGINKDVVAQTWSKKNLFKNALVGQDTELSFSITDDQLLIEGEMVLNKRPKSSMQNEVSPAGFHISTNQINSIISDSVSSIMKSLSLPEGKISGLSMNYHGLELIVEPIFFPAPKFDAIITFEKDYSIETMIDSLLKKEYTERNGDQSVSYCGLELFYNQLNNKTIRIGTSTDAIVHWLNKNLSTHITGSPSYLTQIEGGGRMKYVFEMLPFFSQSREFLNTVEQVDIRISSPKDGISKVNAVLEFKKGEYALNSILKFIIQAN